MRKIVVTVMVFSLIFTSCEKESFEPNSKLNHQEIRKTEQSHQNGLLSIEESIELLETRLNKFYVKKEGAYTQKKIQKGLINCESYLNDEALIDQSSCDALFNTIQSEISTQLSESEKIGFVDLQLNHENNSRLIKVTYQVLELDLSAQPGSTRSNFGGSNYQFQIFSPFTTYNIKAHGTNTGEVDLADQIENRITFLHENNVYYTDLQPELVHPLQGTSAYIPMFGNPTTAGLTYWSTTNQVFLQAQYLNPWLSKTVTMIEDGFLAYYHSGSPDYRLISLECNSSTGTYQGQTYIYHWFNLMFGKKNYIKK